MLKIIELFAGIGSQHQALKNLGIDHEVVAISEIDKYCTKSYQALHGDIPNLGDICKIDKLPKADLWTYSFPCFTGDTLVLTKGGYKRIDEIKINDRVLTHKNRFKKVTAFYNQGYKQTLILKGDAFDEIRCTLNHKFYVREKYSHGISAPFWKEAKDLTTKNYFGIAINPDAGFLRYAKAHLEMLLMDCECDDYGEYKIYESDKKRVYLYAQMVAAVYKRPYQIIKEDGQYVLSFKCYDDEFTKAFYEDGYIWFPVRSVELSKYEEVFDISVEDDMSFMANGVIAHNCQDISVAGNLAGIKEGTRSGLLYQVERLLNVAKSDGTLPKFLLLENVKNLVSKRFIEQFNKWLEYLEGLGYTNYWQVLNAKDYGIPQNRERVFCVSILGKHDPFSFPEKRPLELKLKDMLEDEVDEKYYLSQKMLNCFMADGTGKYPRRERFLANIERENQDVGNAVTTLAGNRPTDNFVVEGYGNKRLNETLEQNEVEDSDFIDAYNKSIKKDVAGTITTRVSDSNCTFIAERNKKQEHCDDLIEKGLVQDGDVVNHSRDYDRPVNVNEPNVAPTLTTRADELGVVVPLKRGYDVEVKPEKDESDGIDVIGNYSKSNFGQTPIVGKNGVAPTVTENHGQVTAIAIKNNTKQGYLLAEEGDAVDISGRMQYHRGTVQKERSHTITTAGGDNVGVVVKSAYTDLEASLFTEDGNIKRYVDSDIIDQFNEGQCASTSYPNGYGRGKRTHDESVSLTCNERPSVKTNLRIRKLTSRECLRLMGWKDDQIDKIQSAGISNSQQYKQAGNGIVVQVLEAIFRSLLL